MPLYSYFYKTFILVLQSSFKNLEPKHLFRFLIYSFRPLAVSQAQGTVVSTLMGKKILLRKVV